jgi:hypothetical protein
MRGNRQLNHALHMAAITQVRYRHSEGRAHYDRKVSEGKTHKEALRALKRRISDALFAAIVADTRRERQQQSQAGGPGGQAGNGSVACAAGSHPVAPALRPSHSRAGSKVTPRRRLSHPSVPPSAPRPVTHVGSKVTPRRRRSHPLVLPGKQKKVRPASTYKEDSCQPCSSSGAATLTSSCGWTDRGRA